MQETVWESVKAKYVKNQPESTGLETKMALAFFRSSLNLEGSLVGDFFYYAQEMKCFLSCNLSFI